MSGWRHLPVQVARTYEIATVLWSSGFRWLVEALGLRSCVSLGCRLVCSTRLRQCQHHVDMDRPLPDRMRLVLERLGPTFVKVGQIVALRPDYVPLEYAQSLRRLHDHVSPFPGSEARRIVEQELGRPLPAVFAEFDEEPFAAASLSQVHRAVLGDGRTVAVKVQRLGIAAQMQRDLELLAFLARRLERRRPQTLGFRPTAAVAELTETTRRELDFRLEARTGMRVRAAFEGNEAVVIPWVDREHTTARMLTMELIEGTPPAPAAHLRSVGLDPDRLLRVGAEAMVEQLFGVGLFHADPHPGNVLLLPGDRVCFLDFGMFGRLLPRMRRRIGYLVWALASGDFDAVAERLLAVAQLASDARPDQFREALEEVVEDWYAGAGGSVAQLLLHELALGARYGVIFPRELMLVARSLIGIDATTTLIAPEVSFRELLEPATSQLRQILLPNFAGLKDAADKRRFDYLDAALELPDLIPELVARLRRAPPVPAADGVVPVRYRRTVDMARALASAAVGFGIAHAIRLKRR